MKKNIYKFLVLLSLVFSIVNPQEILASEVIYPGEISPTSKIIYPGEISPMSEVIYPGDISPTNG